MLETYFPVSKMPEHLRSGPSGPNLDGFAATLARQGYREVAPLVRTEFPLG
jgi:hypothetical protein